MPTLATVGAEDAAIAGTLCGVIVTLGNVIAKIVIAKYNERNGGGFTMADREALQENRDAIRKIEGICTRTDNDGVSMCYTPRRIIQLLERIAKASEAHNQMSKDITRQLKEEIQKQRGGPT